MVHDPHTPRTLHLQPGDTHHYRGFEIYLSDVSRRLVCSYFITGLKRHCRDIAHGEELIDAWHAAQTTPREPGSIRILAADVRVTNNMTAHESRRRAEQARGQHREGGRFARETPVAPTAQPEQRQLTQAAPQDHAEDQPHQQVEQQQAQRAAPQPAPSLLSLVTEDDLGYEPFSAQDIDENIGRGEHLSNQICQIGPKPTLMDCALVLGNLSGIAEQQRLEIGRLHAELARLPPPSRVRASRSRATSEPQIKNGAA